jgi:hypothetical protein
MTGTMLRSAPITPEGCAIVAASRPAAWLVLAVRARRPRTPDADPPVACQSGCHLAATRVKAALRPCGMACGQP